MEASNRDQAEDQIQIHPVGSWPVGSRSHRKEAA